MSDLVKLVIFIHTYFIFIIIAHDVNEEFLLCKSCGHELAMIKDLFYKKSPHAFKIRNDTEFTSHRDNRTNPSIVTIQSVINPHGVHFELVTVTKANLFYLNHTRSIQDTWFPNFEWTICLCPQCLTHIGWYFESIIDKNTNFYAIILDKLFTEEYADTLVLQPKLKMF